jgi:hypothetical protein
MSEQPQSDPFLRLIAVFKLAKAFLFVCAGAGLLHYLNKDVESRLHHLMDSLHVDSDNHIPKWCLQQAGLLTKDTKAALSAIAFFYAALFATEGTGLYLRKRWAEYAAAGRLRNLAPGDAGEDFTDHGESDYFGLSDPCDPEEAGKIGVKFTRSASVRRRRARLPSRPRTWSGARGWSGRDPRSCRCIP